MEALFKKGAAHKGMPSASGLKSSMMLAARASGEMSPKSAGAFDMARAAKLVSGDAWDSLNKAIAANDTEGALSILTQGEMHVNAQNDDGKTPLMLAVSNGNHSLTQELIHRGASVQIKDRQGLTAFDMAIPGSCSAAERDASLVTPVVPLPPEVLQAITGALYACARSRPSDKTPCQYVAEYLRECSANRFANPTMKLPGKDLVDQGDDVEKPLGVSSNELNIALEFFRKFDVDNTGTLEVEETVLLVLRMAEKISGRYVPDQTVLRAAKTLISESAGNAECQVLKSELAQGLDRICPVFRSFRSQLTGLTHWHEEVKKRENKSVAEVVDELYADYDLNSDGILMPDEIALLTRRVADASGMEISDTQVIELFRLMMNHSMSDKDDNGVLTKDEVKDALCLVMDFYKNHIISKYGTATHEGTASKWR